MSVNMYMYANTYVFMYVCMHVTHVNVKHLYFMSALIYALVPESCILSSCLLRVYADVSIHPLRVDAYTFVSLCVCSSVEPVHFLPQDSPQ